MENQTTDVEEMNRIVNFLYNIKDSILIEEFYRFNLTGNEVADKSLIEVSKMMLERLKNDGMINIDDFRLENAKIYGLTDKGIEMYTLFKELAYKK